MSTSEDLALASFAEIGYARVPRVLDAAQLELGEALLSSVPSSRAGTRTLLADPRARALAQALSAEPRLATLLGDAARAIQCTAFAKAPERNWLVGLHQDLSLPTEALGDTGDADAGAAKEGLRFAQPPAAILQQLVAVRLHLDDCGADDGPLRVVPGSHCDGILEHTAALALRDARGEHACLLARGDALVFRPLLLHASSKSTSGRRRAVLHFLFAPASLDHSARD
ncbi:MAG: phytanoyl-CoA dioxygenase family protein [Planctomycetes bacterium]|nr:phytanoyl-CoA dioxygenase family protein [Planctomycetota bacterium]